MATKKEIEINLKSTLDGKGVEEAKQKIDSLNKSTDQLDKGSQKATKSIKNMGQGALQAAYFFDDLQYGIKGILNNIPGLVIGFGGGAGLAGALSLATLGAAKLYEWLSDGADKTDDLAKKMKERNKEIADFLRDAERSRISALQDASRQDRVTQVNKEYKKYVESITLEYKQQTQEIERQINLRKMEIAGKLGADTRQNTLQRLEIERQYESGKIGQHERDYKMLVLDQNLDSLIEQARLKTAHEEALGLAENQGSEEGERNSLLKEEGRLQQVKMSLPSDDEISGIFRTQSKAMESINALGESLAGLEKKIAPLQEQLDFFTRINDSSNQAIVKRDLEPLLEQRDRLSTSRNTAQKNLVSTSERIDKIKEFLRQENILFEPSYGIDNNGKPITDEKRTEEYKKSLDEINTRQQEILKQAGIHYDNINQILIKREGKEREILILEEEIADNENIRKASLEVGRMKRSRKEAEDARKEEEDREKARKEAEREARKAVAEQQQKIIKGASLEGIPENPTARQRGGIAAAREAFEASKKGLEEGISDNDNFIDASEINTAYDKIANTLKERGEYSKKLMDTIMQQTDALVAKINANEANVKRYMDSKLAELEKKRRRDVTQMRTGINSIGSWR